MQDVTGKKLRDIIWRSRGENRRENVKKKKARALNRGNDRPWKLLNLKYLKRWNIRPERRSKIELSNPSGVMANGWKRDRKKRGSEGDGGEKKEKGGKDGWKSKSYEATADIWMDKFPTKEPPPLEKRGGVRRCKKVFETRRESRWDWGWETRTWTWNEEERWKRWNPVCALPSLLTNTARPYAA